MTPVSGTEGQGLTALGKLAVTCVVLGLLAGGAWLLVKPDPGSRGLADRVRQALGTKATGSSPEATPSTGSGYASTTSPAVTIGIAYGTEKKAWLEWALQSYRATPEGAATTIELYPMGSLEAAHALLAGDTRIHVWAPASAVYTDVFREEWKQKNGKDPFVKEESLALSPLVFVVWDERYASFVKKYGSVSFASVAEALQEKGGWDAIAGRPEWGVFKFGHTHPNQSNSGMMTLVLMAYDYHHKTRGLELKDILDVGFQGRMERTERAVGGLPNSTGNLMRDMVLKGPSTYDAVMVYESVAIDYLKSAQGRWGDIRIVYPAVNMWSDNPCYVLDAPWSSAATRRAAEGLLTFLMSEPVQKQALEHGFRPGNPSVSIREQTSPFVTLRKYGLEVDIPSVCEPPRSEVIQNLLASWQRTQGTR